MSIPCVQGEEVAALKVTTKFIMEEMKEIKEDVKGLHSKMDAFINASSNKFAKKDSVDRLWAIVWSIIAFFFV